MNAIKLKEGRTSLTAGVVAYPKNTFCHAAGDVDVTWRSTGAVTTVTGVEGAVLNLYEAVSVEVKTGTWSFE